MASKVALSSSPVKVAAELYLALLKTPKVVEMTKQVGKYICLLTINPDVRQALEATRQCTQCCIIVIK